MGVSDQRYAPAAFPPGNTRYPLYRRMGGPQDQSGRVRINLAPTGTVDPVASSYTDCVIELEHYLYKRRIFIWALVPIVCRLIHRIEYKCYSEEPHV